MKVKPAKSKRCLTSGSPSLDEGVVVVSTQEPHEFEPISVQAVSLTPFYYHGLYIPDGSSTNPTLLTDTTVMFALAHALGCPPTRWTRSKPDYATDISQMPWRASIFTEYQENVGEFNRRLMPVRHALDVEREGGYQESLQKNLGSGNVKKIWYVHEVAEGARYRGALFGPSPFKAHGLNEIIVRVGVGRTGMIRLRPIEPLEQVRLNAATARLFNTDVKEEYRVLDTIRVSQPMSLSEAQSVVGQWVRSN